VKCGAGTTCHYGYSLCERYCCVDSDCHTGYCALDALGVDEFKAVGLCYDEQDAACPADGTGPGAGGRGG
jgi:hypothetical protein